MPKLFSIKPTLTLRGRKFKGPRGLAGKPFHPPLTDFPVVAYFLCGVFDLISWYKGQGESIAHDFFVSGTHVIIAGAIVSIPTALTGFWDWWKGMQRDESSGFIGKAAHTQAWRTANFHGIVMVTNQVLVAINIAMRLGRWDDGYTNTPLMVLSLVIAGLVSLGAAYGGTLVYDYGFNVEQGYDQVWEEREDDIFPKDKGT